MTRDKIAIIAMAGRYSKCDSVSALWEEICQGRELNYTYEETGKAEHMVCRYSKVTDATDFDYKFFGMTKREAQIMDPQHRIFLECCYEVMSLAGYEDLKKERNLGVFSSVSFSTYFVQNVANHTEFDEYVKLMVNDKDFVASRVAYKLNLSGPALSFQCACSSSLVALHYACLSVKSGDCEGALVGGVSISFPEETGYIYQQNGIRSKDGYCRPFQEGASGIIKGDGCSVVMIKSLEKAIEDGDTVLAIVDATAINNDAKNKIGYTAPSVEGHARVINSCLQKAGIEPWQVDYVETHGTGTALGDEIESTVLEQVFARRKNPLYIGSIKGNIGHLDAAAGVTSLVKAVFMLNKNILPPMANYTRSSLRKSSVLRLVEQKETKNLTYIGVSSLGIGGTNVHVLLKKYKEQDATGMLHAKQLEWKKEKCFLDPVKKSETNPLKEQKKDKLEEDCLEQILKTWQEVTGDDNATRQTVCEEIESMEAVILLDKINQKYKNSLTLTSFVECNTLEDVAKLVKSKQKETEILHLLEAAPDTSYQCFLIHPAGGNVLCYRTLVQKLKGKAQIYAIDLPEDYEKYNGIEDLAAHYEQLIKSVYDSEKKLILGGYSLGGNIAYEVAHLFEEQKIAIEKMVFFDSHPPMAYTALGNKKNISYTKAVNEILNQMRGEDNVIEGGENLDELLDQVVKQKIFGPMSRKGVEKYFNKWVYCHKILELYGKKYKLTSECIIFRALEKENPSILSALCILPLPTREEWELYFEKKPTILDAKGNHYTMLDNEKGVEEVAMKLCELLGRKD